MRLRSERRARAVFILVEVVAAAIWLAFGRRQWFVDDEWDFIVDRDGGDLGDLFRPHNEHWSTIPILVYRALWNLVGLRSYTAYLVPVIAAHITAAALLRVIMLRSGVNVWIATAAASAFALFGPGQINVIYPFQIGFTGALAFGLAALLFADRDGGLTFQDVGGLACCLAAMLCAGVGVVLVGSVVVASLLRRGLRVAIAYGGPTGAIFLLWKATAGGDFARAGTTPQIFHFVRRNLESTLDSLGPLTGFRWLLLAVVAVGLPLTLADADSWRRRAAVPVSMLAGAVAFGLVTGYGRGFFWDQPGSGADSSRYIHIAAALLLPTVALAASAIATRWRGWLVPMALLFVVGIPLNVRDSDLATARVERSYLVFQDQVLVTANFPIAADAPRSLVPQIPHPFAPGIAYPWFDLVNMGWLVDGVESGRIPAPGDDPAVDVTDTLTRLVLRTVEDDAPAIDCQPLPRSPMALEVGQRLVAHGRIVLDVEETDSAPPGLAERYILDGYALHVTTDGIRVGARTGAVMVCPVA